MKSEIWTRDRLLAAAGIKPIEWPSGWYLHGEPDFKVSPKAPPRPSKKGKRK